MGAVTSAETIYRPGTTRPRERAATTVEFLAVYAGILLYIWRWQFTEPRLAMVLFALLLLSHLIHRDSLRELGLTMAGLRDSAGIVLPLALAAFVPVVIYGFWRHLLIPELPSGRALAYFAGYGFWSLVQQYLAQSYFNHRLLSVVGSKHWSSILVALMFGAAHIPNLVLMAVTTIGGFLLAEVFARHRNIWPLALAHAAGGFLVAALVPDAFLHHMRVGPGYFFFGLR